MAMHAQIHHDAESSEPPPTMYTFHPFYDLPKPELPEATPDLLMAFGFRPIKPEVPNDG